MDNRRETAMKQYWIIVAITIVAAGCNSSSNDGPPMEADAESLVAADESSVDSDIESIDETEASTSENVDTDLIVTSVLSLLNTEVLDRAVDSVPFPSVENSFVLIDPVTETFECPVSGTVTTVERAGASGGTREYRDCDVQGALVNGQVRRVGASAISLVDFDEFSIVREDSQIVIERGSFNHSAGQDQNGFIRWDWANTVFSTNTAEGSVNAVINEVVLFKKDDVDAYSAEIDATITINGDLLSVSTDSPLESQDGDRYYTSGQILINNDEGFSILIDADGGDPNSALITVDSDGSTESQFRTWSESFFVECLTEGWPFEPTTNCD